MLDSERIDRIIKMALLASKVAQAVNVGEGATFSSDEMVTLKYMLQTMASGVKEEHA